MADARHVIDIGGQPDLARIGGNADCGRSGAGTRGQVGIYGIFTGGHTHHHHHTGYRHRLVRSGHLAYGWDGVDVGKGIPLHNTSCDIRNAVWSGGDSKSISTFQRTANTPAGLMP